MPGSQPAVGDVLQVRFCCYTEKQISLNILHYRVLSTTGASARISAMAVQMDGTMHFAYKALMPPEAKYRGVGVKNLTGVPTAEQTITANDGLGSATANMSPTQCSYLCSLYTLFAGRGYRGRIYPGFIPEVHVDPDGSLTIGGKNAIDTWSLLLPLTINVTDTPGSFVAAMCILRRTEGGLPLPPLTTVPVSSIASKHLIATQRRRGEFGRQNILPF